MIRFQFNEDKAINSCLYILSKIGKTDFHKVFKILYFAERKHLSEYGRPITGDIFYAMRFGPVPSAIYDILKAIRDNYGYSIDPQKFNKYFSVESVGGLYFVANIQNPCGDCLSESEIECLNFSIEDNKALDFDQLKIKSHDYAWERNKGNDMSVTDIAFAGGADEEMLKYITLLAENERLTLA
jgi:Protein of unknown function (DUF4065)